jgi:hypothetical protein
VADTGAAAAARKRVADLLEQLNRVELQVVVVAPPDATRMAARDRARAAASVAGRSPLVSEATAAAREIALNAFARAGFSGTWAATDMAVSVATAGDRVAAASAFEEAALGAVVEDLVDDETLGILRATAGELIDLTGIPAPGSLSTFTSPVAAVLRGPIQIAIVAVFVVVCAIVGAAVGGSVTFALVVLAVGVAILVFLARRRPPPNH